MTADESVVLIPALGLGAAVSDLRLRYTPDARAGVPPHVTVMYPFIAPSKLHDRDLATLSELVLAIVAFDYSLAVLRHFDGGAVYLAPEPAEPFIALSEAISGRFGTLPYGGVYTEIVPHLTVAQAADDAGRKDIESHLAPQLPLRASAIEAWLMVGHNERRWARMRSLRLG